MTPIEALLCDLLHRGGRSNIEVRPPTDVEHFIRVARSHRVMPLLDQSFDGLPNRSAWPREILEACHEGAVSEAVNEVLKHRELLRVLEALALAGVRPLLLKGAALAYSHYPQAALRPRDDLDLLVPEPSRDAASAVLAELGYVTCHGVTGTYVSHQATSSYRDAHGVRHDVDLHWRTSNIQVLARALAYEELEARAVPVPALGPHALAPAPVHALLFACMHRAAHRGDPDFFIDDVTDGGDRLIWLYDMHLLLSRMAAEEVEEFVELAARKQLKAICRNALARVADCTGDTALLPVLSRLEGTGPKEPSEWLLSKHPALRTIGDLGAIDSLAGQVHWLTKRVFPSADYMREYYAGTSVRWLPWMYVRRAAHGLWKLAVPRRPDRTPRQG